MNLPFTVDEFLSVFARYNVTIWPFQVILNLLGFSAIVLAVKQFPFSNKCIAAILAFLWLWVGIAYHVLFFSSINPAAYGFGALYILQGIVFLYGGVVKGKLSFHFRPNSYGLTGLILLVYGMVVYPMIGYFLGHSYPNAPTFGLPCPTTIFTFGILLLTNSRISWGILIIPVAWSLIGSSAALALGMFEDIGLFVAGVGGAVAIVLREKRALTLA